jgi:signal peptidase II
MSTEPTARTGPREALERAIGRRERRETRYRWQVAAVLAAAVFILDQVTKAIVRATLDPGEEVPVVPGFQFTLVRNEGIAFSLFPGRQSLIATLTVVALAVIALALVRLVGRNTYVAAGAGLLFGGSMGNLVDRLVHGGVTDFLDPVHWPAFNVADIGITTGAVLVVLGLMRDGGGDGGG